MLDRGGGDGRFGLAVLASVVAAYLGVDGSETVVAAARVALAETGALVVQAGLEDFEPHTDPFDIVVSRLASHYLADLGPALDMCRRNLIGGGQLLITVVHPVIRSPHR